MEIIRLYECLCDLTRLRILHLLLEGPLCVCHLQEALREPQAKVSKHLAYLKRSGMVEVRRCGHWRIYGLPARRSAQLQANLACLQDCAGEEPVFRRDAARLRAVRAGFGPDCPRGVRQPGRGCGPKRSS